MPPTIFPVRPPSKASLRAGGSTNWIAAAVFYLIFIAGLVLLIIGPAYNDGSWTQALWRGAVFGFVAYATYDLTNLATLRDWPVVMTAVDLVWGTVLAGSVSVITYVVADRIGV